MIRTATRFGADSAKAMLALLFALRGTVLLYQGEELGLPEVDLRRDQLKDPVGDLYYPAVQGPRRLPHTHALGCGQTQSGLFGGCALAAVGAGAPALGGVGTGQGAHPRHWPSPASCFQARKDHPALREGTLELLPGPALAFLRRGAGETLVCAFNLTSARMILDLPGTATPLDLGTGEVNLSGSRLTLGRAQRLSRHSLARFNAASSGSSTQMCRPVWAATPSNTP